MIVTPTRWGAHGEAVLDLPAGRGPRELRVDGGIVGEAARLREEHRGANAVLARWGDSPAPHPSRREVPCAHARAAGGACGGCPWLHLTPESAREARADRVREALARVGVHAPVDATVPGPEGPDGWRHVAKLVAWTRPDGRTALGAYAPRSHEGVSVAGCLALAPQLRRYTSFAPLNLPPGLLRALVVRVSSVTRRVLLTLVAREEHPALRGIAELLDADGAFLHLHAGEGDALTDPSAPLIHLFGATSLEERAGEGRVVLGPLDFFQTNPPLANRLWAALAASSGRTLTPGVGRAADADVRPEHLPLGASKLVDLYAGAGAVSLAIAPPGAAVLLVEAHGAGLSRAREALAERGVTDVTTLVGRVGEIPLPERFRGAFLVANPPRKGLEAGVPERIAALAPAGVALISCHPDALARDLRALCALGFEIERVTPFDMFPGTPHVETLALLRPSAGARPLESP
jgi:23S rRNA (uracil1939-C5)-methyltransferase